MVDMQLTNTEAVSNVTLEYSERVSRQTLLFQCHYSLILLLAQIRNSVFGQMMYHHYYYLSQPNIYH